MTHPLVSIIIPAYNRQRYIRQCVRSALDQRYQPIEVIVVDDGSTDGTRLILEEFRSDSRFVLLTHPGNANRGQAASLNLGLRRAQGDYINILDSDDFLHPEKLAIEVPFMEGHPEVGLAYSNGYRTDADGHPVGPFHANNHREPNDPNALLLDCYTLLPGNALVRRSAFQRAGNFEESFRAAQDHDMLLRLAETTRLAYLPHHHLFYYRMHDDSISGKGQELRWRTGFEILRRARGRYPYRRSTVRKRLAVLNYRLAQVAMTQGRRLQALSRLAMAGALDPIRATRVLCGLEKAR